MVKTIVSIILLVLIAICIALLILLIIKSKKSRGKRAINYYLVETEIEDSSDLDQLKQIVRLCAQKGTACCAVSFLCHKYKRRQGELLSRKN